MQIGWVDFSGEDRQKVMDVMHLLRKKEAVDELGIGIVRDAFANYFFPGTSTIQTRAKYFFIVSYLLKEAGEGKYGKELNSIIHAVDEEERQCGILLLKSSPKEDGIIGKRVLPRGWVIRKPSDIYWNGIRTYKLFTDDSLSIPEYLRISIKFSQQKERQGMDSRHNRLGDGSQDDADAGNEINGSFWNLPVYKKEWRENLNIALSQEEAGFLKRRIEKSVPDSLLAYLLSHHIDLHKYADFAALTEGIKNKTKPSLSSLMTLACSFNHLVYMSRVRYNVLLSQGKNKEANEEWAWIEPDCTRWARVDLAEVFEKLNLRRSDTFTFLTALQRYFQQMNIAGADELIRKREIQLKGINRAKLNQADTSDPSVWTGGRWLDYRFFDAERIINDIYQGEGNSCV